MTQRGITTKHVPVLSLLLLFGRLVRLALINFIATRGSLPSHFVVARQQDFSERQYDQRHPEGRTIQAPQARSTRGERIVGWEFYLCKHHALAPAAEFGVNLSRCFCQRLVRGLIPLSGVRRQLFENFPAAQFGSARVSFEKPSSQGSHDEIISRLLGKEGVVSGHDHLGGGK